MKRYALCLNNDRDYIEVLDIAGRYSLDVLEVEEHCEFHIEFFNRGDLDLVHRLLKRRHIPHCIVRCYEYH